MQIVLVSAVASWVPAVVVVSVDIGVPPLQALSWGVGLVCQDAKDPPKVQWEWSSPQPSVVGADPTETLGVSPLQGWLWLRPRNGEVPLVPL